MRYGNCFKFTLPLSDSSLRPRTVPWPSLLNYSSISLLRDCVNFIIYRLSHQPTDLWAVYSTHMTCCQHVRLLMNYKICLTFVCMFLRIHCMSLQLNPSKSCCIAVGLGYRPSKLNKYFWPTLYL